VPRTIERAELIESIRRAIEEQRGFSMAKIGNTERAVLTYRLVRPTVTDARQAAVYDFTTLRNALRNSGFFAADPESLYRAVDAYVEALGRQDCIGLSQDRFAGDARLLARHGYDGCVIEYKEHEPDRSVPADDSRCYLPFFAGRRLLIVSSFAELLRERANRETFEAVWQNIGKPWFEPSSVAALEMPYGFSPSTWERYPSVLDLFAEMKERMDAMDYDVALIGTGLLGAFYAANAKTAGKIGLSLGGHLQVVFGVIGGRWRDREGWRRNYFNDAWIEMPERYRPGAGETDENYW